MFFLEQGFISFLGIFGFIDSTVERDRKVRGGRGEGHVTESLGWTQTQPLW